MDPLFLLSDILVSYLKKHFSDSRDAIGIYSFDEALIRNSYFRITFSNLPKKIILTLNMNHLDMPWSIEVLILNENGTVILNSLKERNEKQEIVYEVNHGLLNDPNRLGNELANEIVDDLLSYLLKVV